MAIFAFLNSTLGRWLVGGLLVLAVLTAVYAKGYSNGKTVVQARWDRAVSAAIERGVKARTDAERSVERDGDAPSVSDDKFFRD